VRKALILASFGTALYLILRKAYQEGHTGIPEPQLIGPPVYLYALLALAADIVGDFAVWLAAALTVGLIWAYQDLETGSTTLGRFAGSVLAPKVQSKEKRTAKQRNVNAGQKIPKVTPKGKR